MNVTNPKVSIFFLAILPQFSDPERGPLLLQFLSLDGLFILVSLLIMIGFAIAAGTVGHWLTRSPRAQSVLNKLAGLVFIGLALKIAPVQR
jgi:threonine/homoserine/homoserine lactone efflux protein